MEITLGDNLTYDGTAKSATVRITDGLADGDSLNVTLVYSGTANNGTTWNSTEAPVSAGSYTVRARINATNYVLSDTGSSEAFTIARALIDKPTVDDDDTPFSVDTEKRVKRRISAFRSIFRSSVCAARESEQASSR